MSLLGRVDAAGAPAARVRRPSVLATHPGALPIVVSGIGWTVLLVSRLFSDHIVSTSEAGGHGGLFTLVGVAHTAAMTAAMMAPLALSGVRTTAFTSLWWRAGRAAVIFLAAFLLTWTVIAVCLDAVATAWTTWLGSASIRDRCLAGRVRARPARPHPPGKGETVRSWHAAAAHRI